MEDIFLEMNRKGFTEETHWTIAYSPVLDDDEPSGIGGVIATVNEITENVVGERRVVALRNLGARSAEAKMAEEAWTIAAKTLGHHPEDVPFALLYLVRDDRKRARLAGASGAAAGGLDSPTEIASKIRSRCAGSSPEPESRIQTRSARLFSSRCRSRCRSNHEIH